MKGKRLSESEIPQQVTSLQERGNGGEEMTKHKQSYLFCKECGDRVNTKFLRSHLCTHNPNADNFAPEEVQDCFQFTDPTD